MTVAMLVLAAGIQSATPTIRAVLAPQEDFCVDCCSLYCAAAPTLTTSHHLAPQGRVRYDGPRAEDGLPGTAWVVDGGAGESFRFVFEPGGGQVLEPSVGVNVLYLLNGYMKNRSHWTEHNRVSEMDLLVDGKLLAHITLLDSMEPQRIDLPKIPLHPMLNLQFVIRSVFPGVKYNETAISEIRVDGYGHH